MIKNLLYVLFFWFPVMSSSPSRIGELSEISIDISQLSKNTAQSFNTDFNVDNLNDALFKIFKTGKDKVSPYIRPYLEHKINKALSSPGTKRKESLKKLSDSSSDNSEDEQLDEEIYKLIAEAIEDAIKEKKAKLKYAYDSKEIVEKKLHAANQRAFIALCSNLTTACVTALFTGFFTAGTTLIIHFTNK